MQIHSDTGTVIPPDTAALTISKDWKKEMLLPLYEGDDVVPDSVLFLTAVFMRADMDPDFIQEQIDWLRALEGV